MEREGEDGSEGFRGDHRIPGGKKDRLQGPFYSGPPKNKIKLKRVQKVDGQQSKGIGQGSESPI